MSIIPQNVDKLFQDSEDLFAFLSARHEPQYAHVVLTLTLGTMKRGGLLNPEVTEKAETVVEALLAAALDKGPRQ